MWRNIHIRCNLTIEGIDNESELNPLLEEAITPFKITDDHKSELYFCYYKPKPSAAAYRFEVKRDVALDQDRLEKLFRSIKRQIISPEIREPYPQYLADMIAKNIYFGLEAVNESISHNPSLNTRKNFDLIFPYRTN